MKNMDTPSFEQIEEPKSSEASATEDRHRGMQTESDGPTKLDIRFNGQPELPPELEPKI